MKKFFLSHPDVLLSIVAFVLLAMLISIFSWGINAVFFEIHRSTTPAQSLGQNGFDLKSAASLNLRGLSTSTQPVQPAASPLPLATTTASTTKISTSSL